MIRSKLSRGTKCLAAFQLGQAIGCFGVHYLRRSMKHYDTTEQQGSVQGNCFDVGDGAD